jgi:hypothetical protein
VNEVKITAPTQRQPAMVLALVLTIILLMIVAIPLLVLGLACAVIAIPIYILAAIARRMLGGRGAPRPPSPNAADPARENVRVRLPD